MTQTGGTYLKIGLTGGIGSGKSTAARRLLQLGALVYHADEIARRALDPGAPCYDRVLAEFGEDILLPDGSIDRKRLAEIVFASGKRREILNGIIHPYVIETMFSLAQTGFDRSHNPIAVFDVPLLFESGLDALMDVTVLVVCDQETRVRRVMDRDGFSREHVLSRMRAQMPEEEKRLRADYILDNNGSEEDLNRQVDALYATLKAEGSRN